MEKAQQSTLFQEGEVSHKRGEYPALNVGVSFGHGPQKPHNLDTGEHSSMLDGLLQSRDVVRLANFASGRHPFLVRYPWPDVWLSSGFQTVVAQALSAVSFQGGVVVSTHAPPETKLQKKRLCIRSLQFWTPGLHQPTSGLHEPTIRVVCNPGVG